MMSLFNKNFGVSEDEPMTNMVRLKQDKSPTIPSSIKKENCVIEKTCFI